MHQHIDRVSAGEVDQGRWAKDRLFQAMELRHRQFERHADISREHHHIAPDAAELFGEPLSSGLPSQKEHSRRRSVRLHERPQSLTARMRRVALGIDELHLGAPGRTDHARRAFAHRCERDVLGPLTHPVRCSRNRGWARQHHHFNIIEIGETFSDVICFFRKLNGKCRPAHSMDPLGFKQFSETIVGFARTHQNDRAGGRSEWFVHPKQAFR